MKKYLEILIILGVLFYMVGCTKETQQNTLTISAAASLADVMEEISEIYKVENPEITLVFTYGGSGALQTQIEEGAPVDLFISAAQKQMDILESKGMILRDTRMNLLKNQIVLIVPKAFHGDITRFEDLVDQNVEKIALGEPTSVPVGMYSQEIFRNLEIDDQVNAKAVYASDVRQVLSWVESGEVDCGIVYATDAMLSDSIKVVTEAPVGSHKPVVYPAALIEGTEKIQTAKSFLEFLKTEESRLLFEKYGFDLHKTK